MVTYYKLIVGNWKGRVVFAQIIFVLPLQFTAGHQEMGSGRYLQPVIFQLAKRSIPEGNIGTILPVRAHCKLVNVPISLLLYLPVSTTTGSRLSYS